MKAKETFKRTYEIISAPNRTWQQITLNEDLKVKEDFSYFYTLLSFCIATTLVGTFIYVPENKFVTAFLRALISATASYAGFWANYFILTEILNKRFKIFNKKRHNFRLIIYSMSLSMLINALVSIFPGLFFLKIFNIYTLYIVWEGVGQMTTIEESNRTNFVLFLSVSIIAIPAIIFELLQIAIPAAS